MTTRFSLLLAGGLLSFAGHALAAEVSVAVAANLAAPMQKIASAFAQDTGHKAVLAFGSTGKFYAQIKNGAPFQVLLAADDQTPALLEKEGLTLPGTRFTYAIGRLVLWSKQPGLVDDQGAILRKGGFDRIAIADPRLAPYGGAAMAVMAQLGVLPSLQSRLVQGENIAQTHQFVSTGNAALGFVALSQVSANGRITEGSGWVVPANLHPRIRQDAVITLAGKESVAASELVSYLKGDKARAILRTFGYEF